MAPLKGSTQESAHRRQLFRKVMEELMTWLPFWTVSFRILSLTKAFCLSTWTQLYSRHSKHLRGLWPLSFWLLQEPYKVCYWAWYVPISDWQLWHLWVFNRRCRLYYNLPVWLYHYRKERRWWALSPYEEIRCCESTAVLPEFASYKMTQYLLEAFLLMKSF